MVERVQRFLDDQLAALSRQSDVRRAAILGIGFGLLLCVVVTLACLLVGTLPQVG